MYVIQDHQTPNVRLTGQGEAMHRKYRRFELLAVVRHTTVQMSNVSQTLRKLSCISLL
jgi:hypothetical protein